MAMTPLSPKLKSRNVEALYSEPHFTGRPHFDKGFDLRFNVALRLEPAAAGREAVETV